MDLREFDLISDSYAKSQILFTAIDLGIFNFMEKQSKTITIIAKKLKVDKQGLERLLLWLIHLGLIKKKGLRYQLTDFSRKYLLDISPDNILGWVNSTKEFRDQLWTKLDVAIKTGQDQWSGKNEEMWKKFYKGKKELKKVINDFDKRSRDLGKEIARRLRFKEKSVIIDVGGGSGYLVSSIIKKNPGCEGVVTDLVETIEVSKGIYKNIGYQACNFLEEDLPQADYYLLAWIIHDWDEKSIKKILTNCHRNLKNKGRIIVCEILPSKKGDFSNWDIMDGHMMVATKGKERTLNEYISLMKKHGFRYLKSYNSKDSRSIILFEK